MSVFPILENELSSQINFEFEKFVLNLKIRFK